MSCVKDHRSWLGEAGQHGINRQSCLLIPLGRVGLNPQTTLFVNSVRMDCAEPDLGGELRNTSIAEIVKATFRYMRTA